MLFTVFMTNISTHQLFNTNHAMSRFRDDKLVIFLVDWAVKPQLSQFIQKKNLAGMQVQTGIICLTVLQGVPTRYIFMQK